MKTRSNTEIFGTISTKMTSPSRVNTQSSHTKSQKSLPTITVPTQCHLILSLAVVTVTIIDQTTIGNQIQSIGQTTQMTLLLCLHQKRSLTMTMTTDMRVKSQNIYQVTGMNITATIMKNLTMKCRRNHLMSPCSFIKSIQSRNMSHQLLNTNIQSQSTSTRNLSRLRTTSFTVMLSMEGF